MNLLFLNIALATVWWLLSTPPEASDLFVGFVLGFFLVAVLGKILEFKQREGDQKSKFNYPRKTIALLYFCLWFFKEFIKSNLKILWAVWTKPISKIQPHLFQIDVTPLSTFEIVMLSNCITLTPGTTTVSVGEDETTLLVHAFDGENTQDEKDSIDVLTKNILRFTRA
ncbi:MAG: Na+/H+ antiporter subunit E [Deltaproteobacteria bacterium]|nr:Na+/H+ antiporter subunit E [Deltaproteobacteria bacterium]